MKKLIWILSIISLIIVISSCQNVPTLPNEIPKDPTGMTEPTSWGDDVKFNASLDKTALMTPIGIPDTTKIKISFTNYDIPSDISVDNFKVFEDGKAQGFLLSKLSETTNKIDIMIIMDTTGSMGNEIDGLKNSLVNFINYLKDGGFDVKVGIVPYDDNAPAGGSDYSTYDPAWQNLTDLTTARDYVSKLYASGGGDYPENTYGAIMYAWNNASWRAEAQRIFILFTDNSSHYKDDGSYTNFEPQYTKDEVISALEGYATLYMVASTGDYYSEGGTDFSNPADPREIAIVTGGFVKYQSGYEEVDLTKIGIAESIKSTYIIEFQSDSPEKEHEISVYYEGHDSDQGHAKITAEY